MCGVEHLILCSTLIQILWNGFEYKDLQFMLLRLQFLVLILKTSVLWLVVVIWIWVGGMECVARLLCPPPSQSWIIWPALECEDILAHCTVHCTKGGAAPQKMHWMSQRRYRPLNWISSDNFFKTDWLTLHIEQLYVRQHVTCTF